MSTAPPPGGGPGSGGGGNLVVVGVNYSSSSPSASGGGNRGHASGDHAAHVTVGDDDHASLHQGEPSPAAVPRDPRADVHGPVVGEDLEDFLKSSAAQPPEEYHAPSGIPVETNACRDVDNDDDDMDMDMDRLGGGRPSGAGAGGSAADAILLADNRTDDDDAGADPAAPETNVMPNSKPSPSRKRGDLSLLEGFTPIEGPRKRKAADRYEETMLPVPRKKSALKHAAATAAKAVVDAACGLGDDDDEEEEEDEEDDGDGDDDDDEEEEEEEEECSSSLLLPIVMSPDAPQSLAPADDTNITATSFVLGGLSENSGLRPRATLSRAKELGWPARRLPLDEHLPACRTKILTINATMEAVALRASGLPWQDALMTAVPRRHYVQKK